MRKHILSRILASVFTVLACASFVCAQGIHLPPHEKIALKNGLTLLLMQKQGVPIINLYAIVKAGAAADPSGQAGLASITAGLLRKGTKSRTAQQFAADIDFIGGSFDASADSDFTAISAEFMTKDLDRGFDLFSDALLRPIFPQAEVDKLLAQSLDGVKAAKDQPDAVLGPYYMGYLFGANPYGRPEGGDDLSLKRIQRDAIVKFYEAYYTPGNTVLAVSGEFDPAAMKKKLEDILGAWSAKTSPAVTIPAAMTVKGKRLLLIDKPDATQTYFAIGNVGTTVTDPDRVAIRVVNTVFGGRFTSLLNEALRVESGYSYGAEAEFDLRKMPGAFLIASFTKNETTVPAIDLALKVLDEFRKNGLTLDQLASAKSYIKGQFPPALETSGQLARRIALNEFYGLGDDEVNELAARIDAVTPEIARRVIDKHYPEDNLVFVLIGKASEIGPQVKKYAARQDARKISDPGYWPPEKP
jgi:zinc protease